MASKLTCNVTLWLNTSLLEADNFSLDALTTYLATKPTVSIGSVMLEKSAFDSMEVNVKLTIDPGSLTDSGGLRGADYMRLSFTNESAQTFSYYYFVSALTWLSTGAVAIKGQLDTLNTILPLLTFSPRTVTKRRHFDRFKDYSSGVAMRRVHRYDEGLYPIQYKKAELRLNEQGQDSVQWNLVYRNTNLPDPNEYHQINPVELHLTSDTDNTVYIQAPGAHGLAATDFTSADSWEYILNPTEADGVTFTCDGNSITPAAPYTTAIIRVVPGNQLELWLGDNRSDNVWRRSGSMIGRASVVSFSGYSGTTFHFAAEETPVSSSGMSYPYAVPVKDEAAPIKGIHGSYDRTDPRLIRIVKVPYAPMYIQVAGGQYYLPNAWTYDGDDLKADDVNAKMSRYIAFLTSNPLYSDMIVSLSPSIGEERSIERESKLYHSAFHTVKFAYDSFSLTLPYENTQDTSRALYTANVNSASISTKYTISTTMNGRFMFEFPALRNAFKGSEDYPMTLTIARNNEEPVFTSAYVNYLRTGYNYDVKAKQLSAASSIATTAAGIGGGIALGAMSGNPIGAIVGGIVGGVSAAISTAFSQISAEQAIQQRLATAKAQSVGISGSDDVDLMVAYSGNRLTLFEYEPSPETKQALFNLFYFYGYACNETGAPTHNNRYYFDFLQADAEFDRDQKRNFSPLFIEDIQRKLNEGITFLHSPLCALGTLTTTRENWENDLL